MKQQVETLELEKASVDQSLALSCEERDELQKIVDDLQSDLETTREMLQQVITDILGTTFCLYERTRRAVAI